MRPIEGKIVEPGSQAPERWTPRTELVAIDSNQVKFSRGFLSGRAARWCPQLAELWTPFFLSLGVEVQLQSVRTFLSFPDDVERLVVVEIDGENAVIGYGEDTEQVIASSIIPQAHEVPAELLLEYLQRRLLSSLSLAWGGTESLLCQYLSGDSAEEVDVVGTIETKLVWNGQTITWWLGLGVRTVEKLDALARKQLRTQDADIVRPVFGDAVHTVTVELSQLTVPPQLLIDFTRVGTCIDLEMPVGEQVLLFLDGKPFGEGLLRQFNDALAVEISKVLPAVSQQQLDTPSRLSIEVARVELDEGSLIEYRQIGAMLVTSAPLDGQARLVIGGERVAQATIGKLQENFVLTVMPR